MGGGGGGGAGEGGSMGVGGAIQQESIKQRQLTRGLKFLSLFDFQSQNLSHDSEIITMQSLIMMMMMMMISLLLHESSP